MTFLSLTPRNLVVYIHTHQHTALNDALYGPKHGFGERLLNLDMSSGHTRFELEMPVICRYKDNQPTLVSNKVTKDGWREFCYLVEREGVVRVIFSDGKSDFHGKTVLLDAKPPKDGGVKVSFRWEEYDDTILALQQGVSWFKAKFA